MEQQDQQDQIHTRRPVSPELLLVRKAARRDARRKRREIARATIRASHQKTICSRVALGQSLFSVCNEDKALPDYDTVLLWLDADEAFAAAYAKAQKAKADLLFEETLMIADDGRNDWMEKHDNDGGSLGWRVNGEAIARARLRVDTRFRIASKLRPDRYGDKLEVSGDQAAPLVVSVTHRLVQVNRQETLPGPDEGGSTPDEPLLRRSDWDE
jgi:hypothetical protein